MAETMIERLQREIAENSGPAHKVAWQQAKLNRLLAAKPKPASIVAPVVPKAKKTVKKVAKKIKIKP